MSDGDQISINITGGKQGQVAGKIENNNSHIGDVVNGGELTAMKFFEAIETETRKLPEVQSQAIEPLKELATAGQSTESVTTSVQGSTFQKYLDRLRPHAALITKCIAAFGEASLTALASSNPIVAGVLAVAKEVRSAS
jgi:hypothetical protein